MKVGCNESLMISAPCFNRLLLVHLLMFLFPVGFLLSLFLNRLWPMITEYRVSCFAVTSLNLRPSARHIGLHQTSPVIHTTAVDGERVAIFSFQICPRWKQVQGPSYKWNSRI